MIGHLAREVAADLRSRKWPHPVSYGPERVGRDGFKPAVVFMRDREAEEAIVAPLGAKDRNPEVPFNCLVVGRVTLYARSPKPGADVLDHEDACDDLRDAVISALYRILKARKLPLQVLGYRLLRREELHADVDRTTPDTSGPRSADWPGCAARIRFTVGTVIRDVTYTGAAQLEGVIDDVQDPTVTFDGEEP